MNDNKRIDPKEVPALFKRHKVHPQQGTWYENESSGAGGRCGCIVAGLVIEGCDRWERMHYLRILRDDGVDGFVAEKLGYSEEYLLGLVEGWDGPEGIAFRPMAAWRSEEYRVGYEDGLAAWAAIQESYAREG